MVRQLSDRPSQHIGQSTVQSTVQPIHSLRKTGSDPVAPPVSSFHWQKLVALGVSAEEAQAICRRLQRRTLTQRYQRKLVDVDVPLQVADTLAQAIADYDTDGTLPSAYQRAALRYYCPHICRATLWRPQLVG